MNEFSVNDHHFKRSHPFSQFMSSQIPTHMSKEPQYQTEDPIDQYLHHEAHEIVVHPYAVEEPVEEPPSPTTSDGSSDAGDTAGETSQSELVHSMEGLQCDSDNAPQVVIKPTRGKKRKSGASSSLPNGSFRVDSDSEYSPSPLSPKRRRRRIKWPSEKLRAAHQASTRSPRSTESGSSTPRSTSTDASDEVTDESAAPEPMDID